MERIVGLLFSGFAMRLFGATLALWIGVEVVGAAMDLLGQVGAAFPKHP